VSRMAGPAPLATLLSAPTVPARHKKRRGDPVRSRHRALTSIRGALMLEIRETVRGDARSISLLAARGRAAALSGAFLEIIVGGTSHPPSTSSAKRQNKRPHRITALRSR